jgi:hypothetical protein
MSLIHVLGGDAHQITPSGTAFVCPHFSIFIHCISRPSAVQREHTKGSTRPRDYLDEPQTIGGPRPSSTPNPACPTIDSEFGRTSPVHSQCSQPTVPECRAQVRVCLARTLLRWKSSCHPRHRNLIL